LLCNEEGTPPLSLDACADAIGLLSTTDLDECLAAEEKGTLLPPRRFVLACTYPYAICNEEGKPPLSLGQCIKAVGNVSSVVLQECIAEGEGTGGVQSRKQYLACTKPYDSCNVAGQRPLWIDDCKEAIGPDLSLALDDCLAAKNPSSKKGGTVTPPSSAKKTGDKIPPQPTTEKTLEEKGTTGARVAGIKDYVDECMLPYALCNEEGKLPLSLDACKEVLGVLSGLELSKCLATKSSRKALLRMEGDKATFATSK